MIGMIILRLLSFLKHNMTGKISDYKILNQCLTITLLYLILFLGLSYAISSSLMRNHDLRPAGSKALPEAHANSEKIIGHFKGYKSRQEYNPRRGGRKFNRPRKSNFGPNHDKEKKPKKVTNESICHRCGMTGH